jgi:HD-like signal output (HDOD) protein
MLNPNDFKQSISAIAGFGAMPALLIKVWELAKDPATDLDTLGNLLKNDGPLAAGIIRISNSPYYAPATLHSNLPSAINCIGMMELVRVVNLSLAQQLFARDLPSYGISAADYWSDSVASALVMEALAEHTGLNKEDAYTIGILHAIGRVLINRVIEEQGYSVYWDGEQPLQEWEHSAVGFDYAEAGGMLLEHWRFPKAMCDTIRWQFFAGQPAEPMSMVCRLRFTRRLLALAGSDFEKKGWELPLAEPFVVAAKLTPDSISPLLAKCRDDFQLIRESVYLK